MRKKEEIVDKLIDDTINNKIHWYEDVENDYFYCRIRKVFNNDSIDVIFKLKEEPGYSDMYYTEFQFSEYDDVYYVELQISISKNMKPEIKCNKFSMPQLKLIDLLSLVNRVAKKKPVAKKNEQ